MSMLMITDDRSHNEKHTQIPTAFGQSNFWTNSCRKVYLSEILFCPKVLSSTSLFSLKTIKSTIEGYLTSLGQH